MKRIALALPLVALLAAPAHGATLLRLDGIGPLELGQSRLAALDTGWLSHRHSGCPLGGKPYPIDYDLNGSKAPRAITGSVEFAQGMLRSFVFTKGVKTATGVQPGKTTWTGMVTAYRSAGFKVSARYDSTFQATFVSVKRKTGGDQVIGALASGKVVTQLGVPYVPLCE